MFMLTTGPGMNFGFPDVCITPEAAGAPLPYPNFNMSILSEPVVPNVLVDCMPTINLLSKGVLSFGDEAGTAGGVVSHLIDGQTEYIVGCTTILVGGAPAQRLTSITGQNSLGMLPNCMGSCIVPSQVTVLTLG